jgi:ADP-heptose:LPS heptosyltransferase
MHIGVGLCKPLVALFGPTDPNHLLPLDTRFVAVRENSSYSTDKFLPGIKISPDTVIQTVLEHLSKMK